MLNSGRELILRPFFGITNFIMLYNFINRRAFRFSSSFRFGKYLLTAICLLLFLTSCAGDVRAFPFLDLNNRKIPIFDDPDLPLDREAKLAFNDGVYSTPRYNLKKSLNSYPNSASMFLIYASGGPLTLRLYSGGDEVGRKFLPDFIETTEYAFPLSGIKEFDAFDFTSTNNIDLDIKCAGIIDEVFGVEFASSMRVSEGYSYEYSHNSPSKHEFFFKPLADKYKKSGENFLISLKYSNKSYSPAEENSPPVLVLGGDKNWVEYELVPRQNGEKIVLYSSMYSFLPYWVRIIVPDWANISPASFIVEGLLDNDKPLPADFNTILSADPGGWRNPLFELYSWTLQPNVLVFDFADFDYQAKYFKRLAFFVEKTGYVGKIHDDSVIGHLHGWNAHDYRPEDLAAFFSEADKIEFGLNPEEENLRKILLENGLIVVSTSGYKAGHGAIISISQQSGNLRERLLTHEGTHGIFFTNPEYRQICYEIWGNLSDEEREFWKIYLGYNNYNVNDEYLLVNEFQAYIAQQTIDKVYSYFVQWKGPELASTRGKAQAAVINDILYNKPYLFMDMAVAVDKALFSVTGSRIGNFGSLKIVAKNP